MRYASARFFMQSRALDNYIDERMPQNALPLQLFLAGKDPIIDNEAVKAVLERGTQRDLDVVVYEDQTHSIQFEIPDRLVGDMDSWIENRIAKKPMVSERPKGLE